MWIKAVIPLKFTLLFSQFFFDVYSTAQFHRLLSQLTTVRPAKQILVGVASLLLSLVVEAFADQIWTPTRAVASAQV